MINSLEELAITFALILITFVVAVILLVLLVDKK